MCVGGSDCRLTFSLVSIMHGSVLHDPACLCLCCLLTFSLLTKTKEWKCLNAYSLQWMMELFLWGFHEYCPTKHVHTASCGISDYKSICEADPWLGALKHFILALSVSYLVLYRAILVLVAFLFYPMGKAASLTCNFMSKESHMMLPVSTIQHSIGTRFASLQQSKVMA